MNNFTATIAVGSGAHVEIYCLSLPLLSELVAHIELFKPGAVASAHRGLGNVLAIDIAPHVVNVVKPEDNPEAGVDVRPDPAAVFGGAVAPIPPAPTPAPSTADAAPSQTAPEASSGTPVAAPSAPAPMPVPPGAAPAENAAPTTAVERDKDGVPWDHRIHAETKGKVADGTWRKRRNLPDGLHEQITAELKAVAGIQAPAPAPAPAAADAPVAPPTESPYAAFMGYLNTVMIGTNPKLTVNELRASIAETGEQFGLETKLTLQSLKHADAIVQAAARQAVEAFVEGEA